MAQPESILESVIYSTEQVVRDNQGPLKQLHTATTLVELLASFCALANLTRPIASENLLNLIDQHIALIDELINSQVNAIIHHPEFQKLEASWRGLLYLVEQADGIEKVKIRFLDVSWKHLVKDLERAIDFDQSHIFRKIYNEEFGMAGGQPFGVLLGDYYIRHMLGKDYVTDDIGALREMSQVAAAAFAPFITAADPALFGLDAFYEMGMPMNLNTVFEQAEYLKWHTLREMEDARFVGIVMPHVLMRKPYSSDNYRGDGFVFHEDVSSPDNTGYLWGNACYAYGAILVREFGKSGWFSDIRGSFSGVDAGGVVSNIPLESIGTDKKGTILKYATDVMISDTYDKILCDYGFLPLCQSKDTRYAVFYSNSSLHKPPKHQNMAAAVNAKISSMLHYILSMSRFAHYIKIIGRSKVGSFTTSEELETYLYDWLIGFAMDGTNLSPEMRAKYPLAEAKVEIKDVLGKPGVYSCVIHLKPHTQHDKLVSAVKLVTELVEAKV